MRSPLLPLPALVVALGLSACHDTSPPDDPHVPAYARADAIIPNRYSSRSGPRRA